jgi:hypothetical protein
MRLGASVLITTMSASFPIAKDPVLAPKPFARAPCRVANSNTSAVLKTTSVGMTPVAMISRFESPRAAESVARMTANKSPLTLVHVSTDRLGRTPTFSRRATAGWPWPMCSSNSVATEAVPPESAMSLSSRSLKVLQ